MKQRGPLILCEGHDRARDDAYIRSLTPAERVAMVWPLTLQAWGFSGTDAPGRMQRDVVLVTRMKR